MAWSRRGVHLMGLDTERMDIPALLLAAASVNPNINGTPLVQRHPYGHREIRSHYRPLASMLTWLSNRLRVDHTLTMDSAECVPMMAWSHDIQARMFERQPGNMEGMFAMRSPTTPRAVPSLRYPWMRAWQTLESAMHRADTQVGLGHERQTPPDPCPYVFRRTSLVPVPLTPCCGLFWSPFPWPL